MNRDTVKNTGWTSTDRYGSQMKIFYITMKENQKKNKYRQ